jgi:Flp pilus assembly protein TadG
MTSVRMVSRAKTGERGTALVEAAIITPLILLIMVGIFEVGRAYQTYQVLTNAAREGARAAVVPAGNAETVRQLVRQYMTDGAVERAEDADVNVNRNAELVVNGTRFAATQVTVDYPFRFMVLQPVARLVSSRSTVGAAITMRTTSLMRNEAQ